MKCPASEAASRSSFAGSIPSIPVRPETSARCPGRGVTTTRRPPGRSTRANSAALRGANTTVTTSTASSATGRGCHTSQTRFTASGFSRAARRSANFEMSSPIAAAGIRSSNVLR